MAIASAFGIMTQFENRVIHNFVEEKKNWIELWIEWQWIEPDSDLQLKIVQMTQNSGAHNSTKYLSSDPHLRSRLAEIRKTQSDGRREVVRRRSFDICNLYLHKDHFDCDELVIVSTGFVNIVFISLNMFIVYVRYEGFDITVIVYISHTCHC